jgi:Na+/proline symporter
MGFIANYLLIFIILMILFLSMFFIDIRAVRNEMLPQWYLPLRKIITIIVFLSLGSVCLAININVI